MFLEVRDHAALLIMNPSMNISGPIGPPPLSSGFLFSSQYYISALAINCGSGASTRSLQVLFERGPEFRCLDDHGNPSTPCYEAETRGMLRRSSHSCSQK